jgi:hypothetical protein
MDDDKEKSIIEQMADVVVSATIRGMAKSAVVPSQEADVEAIVERTNEQMLVGDAATATAAIPEPIQKPKTIPKKSAPANKERGSKTAKKAKTKAAKKATARKSPSKAKKRFAAKKVGSSGSRKIAGKLLASHAVANELARFDGTLRPPAR